MPFYWIWPIPLIFKCILLSRRITFCGLFPSDANPDQTKIIHKKEGLTPSIPKQEKMKARTIQNGPKALALDRWFWA